MTAENDGFAPAGHGQDQILDFPAADRVHPGGRLVQDDEVRVVDQRLGQTNAPLHAFGKLPHHARAHLAQADHFQKFFGALACARPAANRIDSQKNSASRASPGIDRDRILPADSRFAPWF